MQTRRQFGNTLLAIPAVAAAYGASSVFGGVHIGAITYSFRALPADQVLPALVNAGLSEAELMSNHAEALLGAPTVARGGDRAPLEKWRATVSMDRYTALRKTFADSGVTIRLLCYNLPKGVKDEEIEYSFQMAKALGV